MKDSQQHQTTSCGSRGNRGRFDLTTPPQAARVSFKPEMVGERYGWARISGPELRWINETRCYVEVQCDVCRKTLWRDYYMLRRRPAKTCPNCAIKVPSWLRYRLKVAKHRCTNKNDPAYANYGGRGIKFDFRSVKDAGIYIITTMGVPEKTLELDRIDCNGNYAEGNLRFVSRIVNARNKRTTVLTEFKQEYWPFEYHTVIRKIRKGLSREEIISDAQKAVIEHRANWRLISARLDFMTYEMPDHITVLPYRGNSSTTADMVVELGH